MEDNFVIDAIEKFKEKTGIAPSAINIHMGTDKIIGRTKYPRIHHWGKLVLVKTGRKDAKKGIYMNEKQVRNILSDIDFETDGSIGSDARYLCWNVGHPEATLDGEFTADELETIAWWMRNKKPGEKDK